MLCLMKKNHIETKCISKREADVTKAHDERDLVRDWKKIDEAAKFLRKTSKPDVGWRELLGRTNGSNA